MLDQTIGDEFSGSLAKHRRRGKTNKTKGNRNEASLARVLTAWSGHKFIRVPMSGGFRAVNSKYFIGDVIKAEGDPFPFVIETKHLKSLVVYETLQKSSAIFKLWGQVLKDATRANRLPCMFLRSNGMKVDTWFFVADTTVMQYIQAAAPELKLEVAGGSGHGVHLSIANSFTLLKLPYDLLISAVVNAPKPEPPKPVYLVDLTNE